MAEKAGAPEVAERSDASALRTAARRLATDLGAVGRADVSLADRLGALLESGEVVEALALVEAWRSASEVATVEGQVRWEDLLCRCERAGFAPRGIAFADMQSEIAVHADALAEQRAGTEALRAALAEESAAVVASRGGGAKRKRRRKEHKARREELRRELAEASVGLIRLTGRSAQARAGQAELLASLVEAWGAASEASTISERASPGPAPREPVASPSPSKTEAETTTEAATGAEPEAEAEAEAEAGARAEPGGLRLEVRGPETVEPAITDRVALAAAIADFEAYTERVASHTRALADQLPRRVETGEVVAAGLAAGAEMRRHDAYFGRRMEEFRSVWDRFDIGIDAASLRAAGEQRARIVQRLDAQTADLERKEVIWHALDEEAVGGGPAWARRRGSERSRSAERAASAAQASTDGAARVAELCADLARADVGIARILAAGFRADEAGSAPVPEAAADRKRVGVPLVADEIRKLYELQLAGIVTAEEFARQKAKLLDI